MASHLFFASTPSGSVEKEPVLVAIPYTPPPGLTTPLNTNAPCAGLRVKERTAARTTIKIGTHEKAIAAHCILSKAFLLVF